MKAWLLTALLMLPGVPMAQVADPTPLQFADAAQETRFQRLTAELRCVMCQNQSLADSDAPIAQDLRREVLALIREGNGDDEIKRHLVARYGEFVLYRPKLGRHTWLLWFGPALMLLAGGLVVCRIVRAGSGRGEVPLPDERQEW